MKRKLKNERGETLIEVLASILIGALSVALLFTAVMASGRMDLDTKETDKKYNEVLGKAENRESLDSSITLADPKVTVRNPDVLPTAEIPVDFYGGEGALSYKLP